MSTVNHVVTVVSIARERTAVLRERHFDPSIRIEDIMLALRAGHATGTLTIHLSQGTQCGITFEERQHIDDTRKPR